MINLLNAWFEKANEFKTSVFFNDKMTNNSSINFM